MTRPRPTVQCLVHACKMDRRVPSNRSAVLSASSSDELASTAGGVFECVLMGMSAGPFYSELVRAALAETVRGSSTRNHIQMRLPVTEDEVLVTLYPTALTNPAVPRPGVSGPLVMVIEMDAAEPDVRFALDRVIDMCRRGYDVLVLLGCLSLRPLALDAALDLGLSLVSESAYVALCGRHPPSWQDIDVGLCKVSHRLLAVPPWIDEQRVTLLRAGPAAWVPYATMGASSPTAPLALANPAGAAPAVCFTDHLTLWHVQVTGLPRYRGVWCARTAKITDLLLATSHAFGLSSSWYYTYEGRCVSGMESLADFRHGCLRARRILPGATGSNGSIDIGST